MLLQLYHDILSQNSLFRHCQEHSAIFHSVQAYLGTLRHDVNSGIIEAYDAIIEHIWNSAYTTLPFSEP